MKYYYRMRQGWGQCWSLPMHVEPSQPPRKEQSQLSQLRLMCSHLSKVLNFWEPSKRKRDFPIIVHFNQMLFIFLIFRLSFNFGFWTSFFFFAPFFFHFYFLGTACTLISKVDFPTSVSLSFYLMTIISLLLAFFIAYFCGCNDEKQKTQCAMRNHKI